MHFLGVDVEGAGMNLKKKKTVPIVYFLLMWLFTCHLNCSIEVVFEDIYSHLFYYYCNFR